VELASSPCSYSSIYTKEKGMTGDVWHQRNECLPITHEKMSCLMLQAPDLLRVTAQFDNGGVS
jgi:hypothetical protein